MATDPIADLSRTRRVVLLIDLDPLLRPQPPSPPPPSPYLSSLLAAAGTLLSLPPLSSSSSLSSFKFFFSSLSPILSSSRIPDSPLHLSFDGPAATLRSLAGSLGSLSSGLAGSAASSSVPRAVNVAASMRQLLHDYAWDIVADEEGSGTAPCSDFAVRSTLVVMLSPLCRDRKSGCEFLGAETEGEATSNAEWFCDKFRGVFKNVNDAFVSKDIHFSWVDVNCELECEMKEVGDEESEWFADFRDAIRRIGWGFCSTRSIVLGSALVPFGLIYPRIAILSRYFDIRNHVNGTRATLGLEILDVKGKPLECKCCELELVKLKTVHRYEGKEMLLSPASKSLRAGLHEGKSTYMEQFIDGVTMINVKTVQKQDKFAQFGGQFSEPILVREYSGKRRIDQTSGSSSDFLGDKVLKILAKESGEQVRRNPPIWQILLSFMCREGFWASLSLKNGNGDSRIGILKPFTVSSALLFLPKIASSPNMEAVNPLQFAGKQDSKMLRSSPDMLDTNGSNDFQCGSLSTKKDIKLGDSKRKKNRENLHFLQNLTWPAFYKSASEGLELKLEDLYFSREIDKSKKLKFLKCWMKQVQRAIQLGLFSDGSEHQVHMLVEMESRQADTPEVNEQPISACASCVEDSLTAVSRVQDEVACGNDMGSPEDFLSSVPSKIRQGIESEGVDLGALAERLVKSCTLYIYQNFESEMAAANQSPSVNADDACCGRVAAELMKLVLLDPKDFTEKNKMRDQSCPKSDSTASACVIREYELQIFFRMEILRLQIATTFKESVKLRFVKQICLFLECIQCQMEGGFFGDWSLHNYVGKIIKSRYFSDLEEVVQRIYSKMDLLLFHDKEDELPNLQLNSQDSSKSGRGNTDEDKMDKNIGIDKSVSAENELDEQWQGKDARANREEHLRRLNEAQERRERARRFASFTSWVPDLQRVWAPKQLTGTKNKSDPRRKLPKKKDRTRTTCDMVFETPMTDNKRSCLRANSGKNKLDPSLPLCGSVSKALFSDDN
ncbi:uncharacterized protein LOC115664404 [Syzygium oleosum]|uniref:uncharacterized protein LOC115664404 n=1 Tax=Syzygium oleosum TaxID=219896 RepID=UPI0024BB3A3B|nr:uncharacterized protein LOC115664404 [Syzygium oleosum]